MAPRLCVGAWWWPQDAVSRGREVGHAVAGFRVWRFVVVAGGYDEYRHRMSERFVFDVGGYDVGDAQARFERMAWYLGVERRSAGTRWVWRWMGLREWSVESRRIRPASHTVETIVSVDAVESVKSVDAVESVVGVDDVSRMVVDVWRVGYDAVKMARHVRAA
jgi:hypothetical protein